MFIDLFHFKISFLNHLPFHLHQKETAEILYIFVSASAPRRVCFFILNVDFICEMKLLT